MHSTKENLQVLHEDNHIIVVNKRSGDIVQGDKTGDKPLSDVIKEYIKEKYNKPGNVFLGTVHRLDRPTTGIVIYARTSKALERLNKMLRDKTIKKTYWAVVQQQPKKASDTLTNYLKKNPKNNKSTAFTKEVEGSKIDLWDEHDRSLGHHFNLSIDLTSCTGCGACVIACHAENNVPVVGKDEMRVGRDMAWLRIDRYYSSTVVDKQHEATMTLEEFKAQNPNLANQEVERRYTEKVLELSKGDLFDALENPAENPQVAFQPMMCQHCNHAPCETVCPVAATSHGRQGQNQMAYNRCVGTRYCANNCPYRVRRFNWFNYAENNEFDFNMNNEYGKMVLNPDVVVRSRGVMEKCSMCIQMTQATILKAKKEGRAVNKDEFETACSAACSTGAMVFGDINNSEDTVTALKEDKRAFHVLDYIGTKPNVVYQVKVRNINEA